MVSDTPEAFVDTPFLVVWTGLDDSLSDDGNRCLAYLAEVGIGQGRRRPGIIRLSAGSECRMVPALFWAQKSAGRFAGYYPFVGGHSCNASVILENLSACRPADGALLAMGDLRRRA